MTRAEVIARIRSVLAILDRNERAPSPRDIMQAVTTAFNVTERDILGPRKYHPIGRARQVCMVLAYRLCKPQRGQAACTRYYGRKDHSACWFAIRTVGPMIDAAYQAYQAEENARPQTAAAGRAGAPSPQAVAAAAG